MKETATKTVFTGLGATEKANAYISANFAGRSGIVVCDENTKRFADSAFPALGQYLLPARHIATDVEGDKLFDRLDGVGYLIACGSGSLHDITRYAAHRKNIPFISYPTAASVDGFVSSIAAMTVGGRKKTLPSTPPIALFADPEVFSTAPRALTVSGVGDIMGKYISIFDWRVSALVTDDPVDDEIVRLEEKAIDKMLALDPSGGSFTEAVMEGLVMTGMAIQYHGSSLPASGAEHHLSHLWEMHCINDYTPALHGEKVGVSTLIVLDRYKKALDEDFAGVFVRPEYTRSRLEPVYGTLTDGIIAENTPDPTAQITREKLSAAMPEIKRLIRELPTVKFVRDYLLALGAKTTLAEIELPDTVEFKRLSLEFAPFVRRRITLLKLL